MVSLRFTGKAGDHVGADGGVREMFADELRHLRQLAAGAADRGAVNREILGGP